MNEQKLQTQTLPSVQTPQAVHSVQFAKRDIEERIGNLQSKIEILLERMKPVLNPKIDDLMQERPGEIAEARSPLVNELNVILCRMDGLDFTINYIIDCLEL